MEESVVSSCILEMCTKSICFHPRRRASPTVSDQGPQGRALLRLQCWRAPRLLAPKGGCVGRGSLGLPGTRVA